MREPEFLIPVAKFKPLGGEFAWPRRLVLASPSEADLLPLSQLADDLEAAGGRRCAIERNAFGEAHVRIARDKSVEGCEAYHMTIGPKGVTIAASADAGAYYAVQTLRDMLAACDPGAPGLPACVIDDRPDYDRRGVYYDCSRGRVPTVACVKALVERLARWKVNEFQLYIENVFTFKRHPDIGRGYSPFTPEDILEILDYCKMHHIKLVGSLASFGHMDKILQLPKYQPLGELPGHRGWAGGTTLCPGDPGSIKLVEEMYDEFVPLFEAVDFNVCGDEPWELGQGRSKKQVDKLGKGRVYLDFMRKVYAICQKHGKRMNAWADIVLEHPELLPKWPKDVVMLNWEYSPDGGRMPRTKEITGAGLAAMVCPGTNSWQSHGCRLKMGMVNISQSAGIGLAAGAEGLLNTDWGDWGHRNLLAVSLHNFAWGGAHGWNHKAASTKHFAASFTERFCLNTFGKYGKRLADAIRTLGSADEAMKVPYSHSQILYHVFIGPLNTMLGGRESWPWMLADLNTYERLEAHYKALGKLRWPKPEKGMDPFAAATFQEFVAGTEHERLGCLRVLMLKNIRDKKQIPPALVRQLIDRTGAFAKEYQRVWLLQNRQSRLSDNLALFNHSIKEYKSFLKNGKLITWPGFHGP